MKFIKKIERLFALVETKQAEGACAWVVQWNARYGSFNGEWSKKAKVFLSEEDANAFADSLRDCQKLLQYREDIGIKITKQQRSNKKRNTASRSANRNST